MLSRLRPLIKKSLRNRKYVAILSTATLSLLIVSGGVLAFIVLPSVNTQPTTSKDTPNSALQTDKKLLQTDQTPTINDTPKQSSDNNTDQQTSTPSEAKPKENSSVANNASPTSPSGPAPYKDHNTVTPNPYCPGPNFNLAVARAANSYDLSIAVIPAAGDPSNTPTCGGAHYSTPVVTYPREGPFCSGLTYPTSNTSWGVACSIYGNATYGVYIFTFTVTGTNGYGNSTTRSVSYTFNYQPN